jgi:hypothetical protein
MAWLMFGCDCQGAIKVLFQPKHFAELDNLLVLAKRH